MQKFAAIYRLNKKIALAVIAVWSVFMLGIAPVSHAADDVSTQTNQIPTVLPLDDANVGGDSRYCTGLADMIRTGNIHLWNIPCFIKYISETLIGVAGTLSVLFVIYGGFRYVLAGYTEDKETAKKTIEYALIGLAVTLLAWVIVDLVLQVATE